MANRAPLSISGPCPGTLVLYLLPVKGRFFPSCCDPQTSDSLEQVAAFVLAVVVPLPYPGGPRSTFSGCSHGMLVVCVQQRSCSVPLHVGTRSWQPLPLLLDVTPSSSFGHWPQERAGMAGEGHGALQSTRMLLGAGLHCWEVTVNAGMAAELLRCAVRAARQQELEAAGHSPR